MYISSYSWNFSGIEQDRLDAKTIDLAIERETDELSRKMRIAYALGGTFPAAVAAVATYMETVNKSLQTAVVLGSQQGWVQIPSGYRYRDASEACVLGGIAGACIYLSFCLLGAIGTNWIRKGK